MALMTAACLQCAQDSESLSRWAEIFSLAWQYNVCQQFPDYFRVQNDTCHLSVFAPDSGPELPLMLHNSSWDPKHLQAECHKYSGRLMDDMAQSLHVMTQQEKALELAVSAYGH